MDRSFLKYFLNNVLLRTAILLAILVFGYFVVDNWVVRWDLTQDERYSISEASHKIADSLENPLTIRAYFSDAIPEYVRPLQRQVFDILAEYEAHSGGRIKVERYDPQESTAAASEAQSYGVQPVRLRRQDATEMALMEVYGALVLVYGDRQSKVINIADRYPAGYEGLSALEYEITSRIWELTHEKPKLGITGHLSHGGAPNNPFNPSPQQQPEFNTIRGILGDGFDLEDLDLNEEEPDPAKIPCLLVIRPREMNEVAVFRLDQYLMKGGRVILFITQGFISRAPWGERRFTYEPFKTGLDAWLESQGLRVPNEFVCQLNSALPYPVERTIGQLRVQSFEPNWFWPVISAAAPKDEDEKGVPPIDPENPAVQSLDKVALFWPHPVEVLEDKLGGRRATKLVSSYAEESWISKDLRRVDFRDFDAQPTDVHSSPLVVALDGKFTSWFADQPVPPSLTKAPEEKEGGEGNEPPGDGGNENKEPAAKGPDVVKESVGDAHLVVVGNALFISDPILGQGGDEAVQTSMLASNLVDWLARSADLIALRKKKYNKRTIEDTTVKDELKELKAKVDKGDIDAETYYDRADKVREQQKAGWKRARWINVLLPSALILFAGAVVWIIRAASRGTPVRLPTAVPPESARGHGSEA